MRKLFEILHKYDTEVVVLNLSNSIEYYHEFYEKNKFDFNQGSPLPYKYLKNQISLSDRSLCLASALFADTQTTIISGKKTFWKKISQYLITSIRVGDSRWLDKLNKSISSDYIDSVKLLLAAADSDKVKDLKEVIKNTKSEKFHIKNQETIDLIDKAISFFGDGLEALTTDMPNLQNAMCEFQPEMSPSNCAGSFPA